MSWATQLLFMFRVHMSRTSFLPSLLHVEVLSYRDERSSRFGIHFSLNAADSSSQLAQYFAWAGPGWLWVLPVVVRGARSCPLGVWSARLFSHQ